MENRLAKPFCNATTGRNHRPTNATNMTNNGKTTSTKMDQLRAIVQEQGRIMERMLQEQTRLNQMVQAAFQQQGAKQVKQQ
jgi:tartrate dehydratase beta subunit/fumarate hydratase class I family protein